jgi:uncharacterized protein (TIGR00369 family)
MAFENDLGVRVTRRHKDGVTAECALREGLFNGTGAVHGGVIAAIADEAAWHANIHCLGKERPMTTTELKVNYLRPIGGKKVVARAVVLRAGRHLCVGRVDLFDDKRKLSAIAVVTYMLLDGS